jgi:hypothetical protein
MQVALGRLRGRVWLAGLVTALLVAGAVALFAALAQHGAPGSPGQMSTPGTVQQCGAVNNILAQSANPVAARQAEQCFAQAYAACRPATLEYSSFGVDAGATHTFTIKRQGGGCVVMDRVHTQVNTLSRDYGPLVCTTASLQPDGLHVMGCGQFGEVVVAARGQE